MLQRSLLVILFAGLITAVVWAAGSAETHTTKNSDSTVWNALSPSAEKVIEECGTEPAFSGAYLSHKESGTYTCGRCNAPLFFSTAKFDSRSGWPSFDDAVPGAIVEVSDADGQRTEIRCARCKGHLGHVFRGEQFTKKDTRHCVNSVALGFEDGPREQAFFAGGCFWGVEHFLEAIEGVSSVESGYMGGRADKPTYKDVSSGKSGHAEVVRVNFDPSVVSFEKLARTFFEIHDPTQRNRQGPDVGAQYRSVVFTANQAQANTSAALITLLKKKGYKVATEVVPAAVFWPAEDYHQDYYAKTQKKPYCHGYTKRF